MLTDNWNCVVCVCSVSHRKIFSIVFLDHSTQWPSVNRFETMESLELSDSEVFTCWEYFHLKLTTHSILSENYLSRFVLSARISRKKTTLFSSCCKNRREIFLIANNLCKNKNTAENTKWDRPNLNWEKVRARDRESATTQNWPTQNALCTRIKWQSLLILNFFVVACSYMVCALRQRIRRTPTSNQRSQSLCFYFITFFFSFLSMAI